MKLASQEGKPIMAGFYTAWCMWCRKLDAVTYPDSAVVAAAKNFICLKVDGEKRRDVAYGYGIGKFPTILFLDPSGRVIWREFGYREPPMLARRMQEVLSVFTNSREAELYIKSAFDEARLGRLDQAVSILDKAIALHPDDARLYASRSFIYKHRGDLDAALADLDKSLSINPTDDGVRTMRGAVYYEKKDFKKAMDDYNKAISINPWEYEAYNGRGIIYLEQNSPDQAIKNFNTTILINPHHASAHLNRGIAYTSKGMLDKAIGDFSMAVELNPDLMNAYSNRANAYMNKKQYDKSWDDVHLIERRGFKVNSEFIAELRRLSGRDR